MKTRMLVPTVALLFVAGLAALLFGDASLLRGAPAAQVSSGFSYQGSLQSQGAPVDGAVDLQFVLYDDLLGGSQIGPTLTKDDVLVSDGLFTVSLDFGDIFDGTQYYLDIAVRPGNSTAPYTPLTPRQALQPAPYASYAISAGTAGSASSLILPATLVASSTGTLLDLTNTGDGQAAEFRSGSSFVGLFVSNTSTGGGIRAETSATGNRSAITAYNYGTDRYAVEAEIIGTGNPRAAIYARTAGTGQAIDAEVNSNTTADAIFARTTSTVAGSFAGVFSGPVNISGNLTKSSGSFKIDHPLDPANKYLSHSFVESPDMKNIYDGVVTTDAEGLATVAMPDWFEALNRDFRYQLTVIGEFAQAIIKQELLDGSFTIQTDKPNVKVSWQVTGIRQDAWANAHRIPVEEDKPAEERGTYIHPELFGQPAAKSLDRLEHPLVEPGKTAP